MAEILLKHTAKQIDDAIIKVNGMPAEGVKGDKGEQGEQGIQGLKGDTGATPNITIGTTTTLPAGSEATVTKTGTVDNPVFNFGIPKGADGTGGSGSVDLTPYQTKVDNNINGTDKNIVNVINSNTNKIDILNTTINNHLTNHPGSGGDIPVGEVNPDNVGYIDLIATKSPNILDLVDSVPGYFSYTNGIERYYNIPAYTTSNFLIAKPNTNYSKTHSTTKFLEYDSEKNFIKETTSLNFGTTSSATNYFRIFLDTANVDTEIIVEGKTTASEYKPYNPGDLYKLPVENFEIEPQRYSIEFQHLAKNTVDEIYKEVNDTTRKNENCVFRNRLANKGIFVETHFDGGNQAMHPTIVKFDTPWNGYKYWLGYTPYPFGDDREENPCVAVSNDLIYWVTPNGGSNNPFDVPGDEFKYWSDTHLLYNSETNELELWYRGYGLDNSVTFVRKRSSDGVSWSNREYINKPINDAPSFVVTHEEGKYQFFAVREGYVYESADNCVTWQQKGVISVEYGAGVFGNTIWHYNITKDSKGVYHLLGSGYGADKKTSIYYYKSNNGLYWTGGKPILKCTPESNLKFFYRPCLVLENGLFYVYYTCVQNDESWGIRLSISENEDIYTIKGYNDYRYVRPSIRPKFGKIGDVYFDTKLGKPVFCKTEGYRNNYNDLYSGTTPSTWVDSSGDIVTENVVNLVSISLNKNNTSINQGNTEQLTVNFSPTNTTQKNVTWASSNTNIATVSPTGLITAKSVGSCTIACTSTPNNDISATCSVTVLPTMVTGITLNKSTLSINTGNTETLVATITPSNATNQNVTWTSSNTNVATVSSVGLVTSIGVGSATITATTQDGSYTATCNVTVQTTTINVTSVSLNKSTTTIINGSSEQLVATISPSNATNKEVTWTSSNSSVASVSSTGLVAGVSEGSATITVTTIDGNKTATCNVTISSSSIAVTSITLNKSTSTLTVPNTEQLTVVFTPSNATNQNVTWSSNNTSVATVSASGLVTAESVGTAIVTATTQDGNKTATCNYAINTNTASDYTTLKITVPQSPTTAQSTFKLSKVSTGVNRTIEWYKNDILQTLPTSSGAVSGDSYSMEVGENIIKIKGGFYASNNECDIEVITIQSDLTTCNSMFYKSKNVLCDVGIPNTVTNVAGMFQDNARITNCPLLNNNITDMSSFLLNCTTLTTIPDSLPNSVTNLNSAFANCSSLTTVNENILPNNSLNCTSLFAGTNITTVPIIPTNAVNVSRMFQNVKTITTLPQANVDLFTTKPTSMTTTTQCYSGCTGLITPNLASIPTEWK